MVIWAKAFPYSNYLCRAPDIAAVGSIFNVLSYKALLSLDLTTGTCWATVEGLRDLNLCWCFRNKQGGRWIINLHRNNRAQFLDTYWLEILFFLIGEHADQYAFQVMLVLVWLLNRLIFDGLGLVISHTEKSCIASYYKQFSTNIKIKSIKLIPVLILLSWGLQNWLLIS